MFLHNYQYTETENTQQMIKAHAAKSSQIQTFRYIAFIQDIINETYYKLHGIETSPNVRNGVHVNAYIEWVQYNIKWLTT